MGEIELPGEKQVYEVQRVVVWREKNMKFMKKLFHKKEKMVERKRIKRASCAYGFEKIKSEDIIKLSELFQAENVFMEIINLEKDSSFYRSMQSRKNEHVLFSNSSSKAYADIFISKCFGENFTDMLDEIIDSRPEILCFYFTDLSLENFLYNNSKIFADKMITKQIAVCVFSIMFDENTFLISYNSDLFGQSDFLSKMDEILCNQENTGKRRKGKEIKIRG